MKLIPKIAFTIRDWGWLAACATSALLVVGVFVALSLSLIKHGRNGERQVADTLELSHLGEACEELMRRVRSLRAPAGDLFISGETERERRRLADANMRFQKQLADLRTLTQSLTNPLSRAETKDRLQGVEEAVGRLNEQAQLALAAGEAGRERDALRALAAVNREGAAASRLLGDLWRVSLREQRTTLGIHHAADRRDHAAMQAGLLLFAVSSLVAIGFALFCAVRAKAAQTAALAAEAQLQQLIDVSPLGVLLVDSLGKIRFANPVSHTVFGYAAGELQGRPVEQLLPAELRDAHRLQVRGYLQRPGPRVMAVERQVAGEHRSGRRLTLEVSLAPIALSDGPGAMALVTDITERRQLAERSSRQAQLLQLLTSLQSRFISHRGGHNCFDESLAELVQLAGGGSGLICEVQESAGCEPHIQALARFQSDWTDHEHLLATDESPAALDFQPYKHLLRDAIASQRPLLSNAPVAEPRTTFHEEMESAGRLELQSLLAIPLIREGAVIGLLCLGNRPGGFSAELATELEPVAATFAALLEAWRNEGERQQVTEALRCSFEENDNARERLQLYALTLEEKNAELEGEHRKAESASRAKSEFLANMSHEIRTPMTAILGYADMLLEQSASVNLASAQVESLQTIHRNGEHLLGLINDILDLSKIEAGKMDVEHIECQPMQILADVEGLMRIRAEGKALSFRVEHESRLPLRIESDPTRLRQILVNLVGNALKFTEVGGVQLACRLALGAQPRLEFDVSDSGIGMTAEQIERLFRPFTQADTSMARKFGGTGLGLTISKRLAQMLQGDIAIVRSEAGRGTTFRLTINVTPEECQTLVSPSNQLSAAKAGGPAAVLPTLPGCRILLAEDGPDNQRLISFVLKKAGAEVEVVENGAIACERALTALAAGNPFEIVLMDMAMPVLDGYQAAARLRAADYPGPIIALTAHAMAGDREKCLAVGCSGYATKPIDRMQLLTTIAAARVGVGDAASV